jgi:hypothetical protein
VVDVGHPSAGSCDRSWPGRHRRLDRAKQSSSWAGRRGLRERPGTPDASWSRARPVDDALRSWPAPGVVLCVSVPAASLRARRRRLAQDGSRRRHRPPGCGTRLIGRAVLALRRRRLRRGGRASMLPEDVHGLSPGGRSAPRRVRRRAAPSRGGAGPPSATRAATALDRSPCSTARAKAGLTSTTAALAPAPAPRTSPRGHFRQLVAGGGRGVAPRDPVRTAGPTKSGRRNRKRAPLPTSGHGSATVPAARTGPNRAGRSCTTRGRPRAGRRPAGEASGRRPGW